MSQAVFTQCMNILICVIDDCFMLYSEIFHTYYGPGKPDSLKARGKPKMICMLLADLYMYLYIKLSIHICRYLHEYIYKHVHEVEVHLSKT